MTTLAQLVTGLDALDDFVRLRLRQAVAELRTRQDQIDATLAGPDAAPEHATAPPVRPGADDSIGPLNEEESEAPYPVITATPGSGPRGPADRDSDRDEGPPQTWLV